MANPKIWYCAHFSEDTPRIEEREMIGETDGMLVYETIGPRGNPRRIRLRKSTRFTQWHETKEGARSALLEFLSRCIGEHDAATRRLRDHVTELMATPVCPMPQQCAVGAANG